MNPAPAGRARLLRELFASPLFWGALALKLLAGSLFASHWLRDWFAPFVSWFTLSGFQDPWAHFAGLGELKAFPYPPGMLYLLAAPRALLSPLLPADAQQLSPLLLLSLRLPSLLADLAVYAALGAWFRDRVRAVTLWWWCSPLVFYVAYVHGQLDLIPTGLFVCALFLLEQRRFGLAMLGYGLALSTKQHLWIALPFLLIWLRPQVGLRRLAGLALLPGLVWLAFTGPWLMSEGFRRMVLMAEEQSWVFAYRFPATPLEGLPWAPAVYLCPAALALILLRFAGYPRHNWDLTLLFLGLVFSAFVLLVPPMQGWVLWSAPFLIYMQIRHGRGMGPLFLLYSLATLAYFLLGSRSDLKDWAPALAGGSYPLAALGAQGARLEGALFTLMQVLLSGAMGLMYVRGVRGNEVYTRRERPLMVGLAGDSGAGKDRLSGSLESLFGPGRSLRVSGDDYHKWERGDPRWELLTHLDPQANRLHQQLGDVLALRDGRSIVQAHYDHKTGRFTEARQVDPRRQVFVVGLHALHMERLRQAYDLAVFLDPEERLRRHWKLKRDGAERGHSAAKVAAALKRRAPDRRRSILPQRSHADLVLSMRAAAPFTPGGADPALAAELWVREPFALEALTEALQGLPGMRAELGWPKNDEGRACLRLEGSASAEDLDRLARSLVPDLFDLVGSQPRFGGGLDGALQLAFLVCLSQAQRFKMPL